MTTDKINQLREEYKNKFTEWRTNQADQLQREFKPYSDPEYIFDWFISHYQTIEEEAREQCWYNIHDNLGYMLSGNVTRKSVGELQEHYLNKINSLSSSEKEEV